MVPHTLEPRPPSVYRKFGTVQIPVDSFTQTSGGDTMMIELSNPEDSSPPTTDQRQNSDMRETTRLRCSDPYPYGPVGLAPSRRLWENDANRTVLSHLQDLPLSTAVGCHAAFGSALSRGKGPSSKRLTPWTTPDLLVASGRQRLTGAHGCNLQNAPIPPSCRGLSQPLLAQRGARSALDCIDGIEERRLVSQR